MKDLDLNRKGVGLVTGSTSGLGRKVADYLADRNFYVGINGRDFGKTRKIASENANHFPLPFDTTDLAACFAASKELGNSLGKLDYLVCNVGGGSIRPDLSLQERINEMITLNLISSYNVVEAFADILKDSSAKVILMSSIATTGKTDAPLEYVVAKSALNVYGTRKAETLGKRGITVNLISPGNLMFPGSVWDRRMQSRPDSTLKYLEDRVPLGRFIDPIEIAELIYCIFAGKFPNITGHNFVIDGGQSL